MGPDRRSVILVLDNRDSFTFNLVQALAALGAEVRVERADRLTLAEVHALAPSGVLVGPGPGTPERAGVSLEVARDGARSFPVLGVCLGHQAIAVAHGARLRRSADLAHGQTRLVEHDGAGWLAGLPRPLVATRYNSLCVEHASLPPDLVVTARTEDGEIQGLRHRELPLEGVQFHPEAALTEGATPLFANFLAAAGARVAG